MVVTTFCDPFIRVVRGSAAELHAVDPFAANAFTDGSVCGPQVWICDFDAPVVVLGSRQRDAVLDLVVCAERGLAVAHRRSGGGAVLMYPGDVVWIDVVLPHGVVSNDVRGSMIEVGRWWQAALGGEATGDAGELRLHEGGMESGPWSELVCFAGLGPGEVLGNGRKLVGLSQRRTRHGLRVQGLVHRRSSMAEMSDLFAVEVPDTAIEQPAVIGAIGADSIADRLCIEMSRQLTTL